MNRRPLCQWQLSFILGLCGTEWGHGFSPLRASASPRPWSPSSSSSTSSSCRNLLPINGNTVETPQPTFLTEEKEKEETEFCDPAFCVINFDNINEPYLSPLYSESTFVEFTEDGLCVPAGPVGKFKEQFANALAEPLVELIIAASVLLNSLLVALSTLDALNPYLEWIRGGELSVSLLFGLDFLGRWFSSSKVMGKHVLDAQFALDVVVVILPLVVGLTPEVVWEDTPLPDAITSPSGLINLELLRVLRLRRVLKDLATFERFAERVVLGTARGEQVVNTLVQEWQLQLARVLLSLFTLVSVATGLVYTAENGVNPAINNYFDALYFGLTTLTTVGFGDITPMTVAGKLVVCGAILVGVAVVPAQAAALVEALLEREETKRLSKKKQPRDTSSSSPPPASVLSMDTAKVCPQCGATFHWVAAQYCYSCGEELD